MPAASASSSPSVADGFPVLSLASGTGARVAGTSVTAVGARVSPGASGAAVGETLGAIVGIVVSFTCMCGRTHVGGIVREDQISPALLEVALHLNLTGYVLRQGHISTAYWCKFSAFE